MWRREIRLVKTSLNSIDGVMYYTAEHLTEYDLISANTADGSVLRIDVICM